MIINCTCRSPYQDKVYGTGKRLANKTTKGARCTVCGKEISMSLESKDKKK